MSFSDLQRTLSRPPSAFKVTAAMSPTGVCPGDCCSGVRTCRSRSRVPRIRRPRRTWWFEGAAASARMRHEARAQCSCAVNTAAGRSTRGRPEVARGRRLLERRRFRLDRTRDREEVPVAADDRAVAGWVGRWRSSLRVGEVRDAVPTHALRHPEQLSVRLRRWGSRARTAARQQVLTRLLGRLERGRLLVDPRVRAEDLDAVANDFRVGEVGHPVRAHALGECERPGVLALRGQTAAALGRARRATGGDRDRATQHGERNRQQTAMTAQSFGGCRALHLACSGRRLPAGLEVYATAPNTGVTALRRC